MDPELLLASLLSMGFEEAMASLALQQTGHCNLEAAVEWLTVNAFASDATVGVAAAAAATAPALPPDTSDETRMVIVVRTGKHYVYERNFPPGQQQSCPNLH